MTAKDMRLDDIDIDDRSPMETLPYWARATNPIVRRHLGLYWRTLPPEFEPILYITGFWVAALLAGIVLPFITDLATTVIVVSILVIPVGMLFYLRALFSIAANSAAAMSDEIRSNTMQLLMSTPMSLDQIFLGKAAAAIWRKMDDLVMIVHGAALFGPPLMIMHYASLFPLRDSGPPALCSDCHPVAGVIGAAGFGAGDVRHHWRRHWRVCAVSQRGDDLISGGGRLLFSADDHASAFGLAVFADGAGSRVGRPDTRAGGESVTAGAD